MSWGGLIGIKSVYIVVTGCMHADTHTQYSDVETDKQYDTYTHMYAR